ncbi:MAG: RNA-binding S4 domain-containing protein [Thermoanaerobacteraceae bacterium]|nr:RNA-binding S4 domain-containing protein [Thermoanaerobacteraceae bacterium]
MRLDKFLKVSRLIKRRTVAKEACNAGKVTVNGKVAKSGTKIKEGDVICIQMGAKQTKVKVLSTVDSVPASKAGELYEVIE